MSWKNAKHRNDVKLHWCSIIQYFFSTVRQQIFTQTIFFQYKRAVEMRVWKSTRRENIKPYILLNVWLRLPSVGYRNGCFSIIIREFDLPSTGFVYMLDRHSKDKFLYVFDHHTSCHYNDVIMGAIASQITGLTIVYSIVDSDADQRKYQSSASLAFVRGIHRGPVNSSHKWPVTRKMFPFGDVIMQMSRHLTVQGAVLRHFLSCLCDIRGQGPISVRNVH